MDTSTIIACAAGLLLGAMHIAVDGGIGKLIDCAFAAVGLQSGKGPLDAMTVWRGDWLVVSLKNQGRHNMQLAGIQGTDGRNGRVFPVPSLEVITSRDKEQAFRDLAKVAIGPGKGTAVFFERTELVDLDCRELAIVDRNARLWPVENFELDGRR